jgi:LCCL domain-containing protein
MHSVSGIGAFFAAILMVLLAGCQGTADPKKFDRDLNGQEGEGGNDFTKEEQDTIDFFTWHGGATWDAAALGHRGNDGSLIRYDCPENGRARDNQVWGTDVYSDDSSVCTAAVHYGLITPASGGVVEIKILPGQDSYRGSTRNGFTSLDYGKEPGSYTFTEGAKGQIEEGATIVCGDAEAEASTHQTIVHCDLTPGTTGMIRIEVAPDDEANLYWEGESGARIAARQLGPDGEVLRASLIASYGGWYLPSEMTEKIYVLTWENVGDDPSSLMINFTGNYRIMD